MEKIPRSAFTEEFKEEAAKMVIEGGLSQPEVCRRLSLANSTLARWVRQAKKRGLSTAAAKRTPITEEEMEVARLKREIAELKMERDILKNATAYFAKESLKGTRS
jgi:transposase